MGRPAKKASNGTPPPVAPAARTVALGRKQTKRDWLVNADSLPTAFRLSDYDTLTLRSAKKRSLQTLERVGMSANDLYGADGACHARERVASRQDIGPDAPAALAAIALDSIREVEMARECLSSTTMTSLFDHAIRFAFEAGKSAAVARAYELATNSASASARKERPGAVDPLRRRLVAYFAKCRRNQQHRKASVRSLEQGVDGLRAVLNKQSGEYEITDEDAIEDVSGSYSDKTLEGMWTQAGKGKS